MPSSSTHAAAGLTAAQQADLELLVPPRGVKPLEERKVGRYTVRNLRRDEIPRAIQLFRDVMEYEYRFESWDWRHYQRNPGLVHMPAAFTDEGALAGVYPCTLRPARVLGTDLMTQHACRTLVHPDHRGGGRLYIAFLRFSFDRLASIGVHFGFGGGAKPAALKMGAWVLGNKEMCALPYFERRLSLRLALTRRLGGLGTGLARVLDGFAPKEARAGTEYEVAPLDSAGEEFDRLWERKRDRYDVLLRRDAREVDWRWLRCPVPSRVLVARRGGEAEGYLALRHHEGDGVRLTTVLDVFTGKERGVAAALLAAAGDEARAASSDFLQMAPKQGSVTYELAREAPWKPSRRAPDHVIVGHTSHDAEAVGLAAHVAAATDGERWHYCLGDSDFFD